MKYLKNIKYIFMIALIVMLVYPLGQASAVNELPYTPQVGRSIEHNCASLKYTLKELRKRDISSRVARVYIYEFLLVRTDALATRLANNKLDNRLIVADNLALHSALDKFKSDYTEYDNNLTGLIGADCDQSAKFYKNLQATRKVRKQLASDVKKIDKHWQRITKDINAVKLSEDKGEGSR